MADENSILGTSGKEAIPYEWQVKEQESARRRALAAAMLQRGLAPHGPVQTFGHHAAIPGIGQNLVKGIEAFLGARGMRQADDESAATGQEMERARSTDMREFQALQQPGMKPTPNWGQGSPEMGPQPAEAQDMRPIMQEAPADIKAAIARAQASRFGDVRAMGTQLQKDDLAKQAEIAKIIGGYNGPAGANRLITGDRGAAPPVAPTPVIFGVDPANNPYGLTTNNKGETGLHYAPKETKVSQTQTVDNKEAWDVNKKRVEHYIEGGKGFEEAKGLVKHVQASQDLLRTLDDGAQTGSSLATAFQGARKFVEFLGGNANDITEPTDRAVAQLNQRVLDKLGGKLGAQVSNTDRDFMAQASGDLSTNPETLRRLILLDMKYSMMDVNKHNDLAKQLASQIPGGVALPYHDTGRISLSERNANDFQNLIEGKSFAPVAKGPAVRPGAATPPGMTIKRRGQP